MANKKVTTMKRSFYLLLIMVVATIAACTKPTNDFEDERLNPASTTYTYTITASNGDLATKSDYDAEGNFKWSAGDAISVLFHNNDAEVKNKFFTLTLVSGANSNSATFSGEIDNGYTIGASDGNESDKKIWALFPASDKHVYNIGGRPTFFIPAETDYTATHFSANLPMYALNTSEGALSFGNLCCAYKFTVTNIDASKAPKIRAVVTNQLQYALSGKILMSSGPYLSFGSLTDASQTVSYVCNVDSEGNAIFYVPCRHYSASFKPSISIENYSTGIAIKSFTASSAKALENKGDVQPITLNVSGGNYYTPAIAIDGNLSDWSEIPAFESERQDRVREWKFKSDAYNVYFYFKLRKNRCDSGRQLVIGFNTDNDNSTGSIYDENKIFGNEATVTVVPFTNASGSNLIPVNGIDSSSSVSIYGGNTTHGIVKVWNSDTDEPLSSDSSNTYIEISIPRDKLNLPAAGSAITIGCAYDYYVTGTQSITLE